MIDAAMKLTIFGLLMVHLQAAPLAFQSGAPYASSLRFPTSRVCDHEKNFLKAQVNKGIRFAKVHGLPSLTCDAEKPDGKDQLKRDLAFQGEHHDAQWKLTIQNFRGKWQGDSLSYDRMNGDDTPGRFDFGKPTYVVPDSCYEVTFSDDGETGQWKGTGLRFTKGTKILPLSRKEDNSEGRCWQFPGVGGQGARKLAPGAIPVSDKFHHEINFFHERTRSMIVVSYSASAANAEHILLRSIGITPFRCQHGCAHGPREKVGDIGTLLQTVSKLKGTRMSFRPDLPLDVHAQTPLSDFDPRPFTAGDANIRTAVFEDNIVMAIPDAIPVGKPFSLVFGCLQSPAMYKQVRIDYAASGDLLQWTYDKFTRP